MPPSPDVMPPAGRSPARGVRAEWNGPRPLVSGLPVTVGVIVVALVLGGAVLSLIRKPGLPARLANDYARMAAGLLAPEVQTADPADLSRALSTGSLGFSPRVQALDPDFDLIGGRVHQVDGRPAAVWFYRSASLELAMVQAFRATMDDLGPPDDVREAGGLAFAIHRKTTQTLVCWPESPAVYCFISTLPGEEVVRIARRHARPPAPAPGA